MCVGFKITKLSISGFVRFCLICEDFFVKFVNSATMLAAGLSASFSPLR